MTNGDYGQQPGQYGQQPPAGQYGPPPGPGQYAPQPGPGQYGPPPGQYGPPANPYGAGAGRQSFGVIGGALAAAGAILLVIAFTAVNWEDARGDSKFSDVHRVLGQIGSQANGVAKAYFAWLGWVLLIAAVVLALAANLPSPASGALRALGALVGVAGIVLTFLAIKLADVGSYSDYIKHADIAFYLTLGGFLLTTIGALIGPQRRNA